MASTPATDDQIEKLETQIKFWDDRFTTSPEGNNATVKSLIARIKAQAAKVAELEAENVAMRTAIMALWDARPIGHIPSDLEFELRHSANVPPSKWIRDPDVASEPLSDAEKQRRSFAFGNAAIDNPDVTREIVDQEAEKMTQDSDLFTGTAVRCFKENRFLYVVPPSNRATAVGPSGNLFNSVCDLSDFLNIIPELTPQAAHDSLADWPEAQAELRRLYLDNRKPTSEVRQ